MSAPTIVLDSLRLEPRLSVTSTLVDAAAIAQEVRALDDHLVALLVRAADVAAPPADIFVSAWASIASQQLDTARTILEMPVIALPDELARWHEVVIQSIREMERPRALFVHLADIEHAHTALTNQLRNVSESIVGVGMVGSALVKWFNERREESSLLLPVSTLNHVPGESASISLDAARALRDTLLKDEMWLTSTQVAEHGRGEALETNPHEYASRLRRERRLLGVRIRGQYLHPAFQFLTATGAPHPKMSELLAILPAEDHGWAGALWCFSPTNALDGQRPADRFLADPDAVIALARRDFEGDNADW
ncbi:hypothetical protein DFR29_121100 [Tahibacter aquaticus]|uniref:Uncharacterized protein n=1 Tax=Tahibacter aquaticus TaxID=520092 RepID=A0A4R6YMC1_9GAMM|nr:hypothetical protein [Tahibacter aquaticus]TDR38428.1 hypothetical protein DFR29_121100 [Tahibacter aquaticus]